MPCFEEFATKIKMLKNSQFLGYTPISTLSTIARVTREINSSLDNREISRIQARVLKDNNRINYEMYRRIINN